MPELFELFLMIVIFPIVLVASIPASLFGFFWIYNKIFHPRDTFGQEK